MAGTCPHGYAPGECLICATLAPQTQASQTQVRTSPLPSVSGPVRGGAVRPDAVFRPDPTGRPNGPGRHRLLALISGLLALGAAVWLLSGLAFALLHVLELLVVAGGAGWVGYRLGHWRGRHQHH
jgi:hypothetical protein